MKNEYMERLKDVVKMNPLNYLNSQDLWNILDVSKALIFDGHFKLLSGQHSDTFFRFANISQFPFFMAKISKEMVSWLKARELTNVDVVIGPASQGMFLAYDIARELAQEVRIRAVYTPIDHDTGRPQKDLIDGFEIKPNEKVLIVNDITTTGSGINTLVELVKEVCLAKVAGICVFANRGIEEDDIKTLQRKYEFHSIIDLDLPAWPEEECQLRCPQNRAIVESKTINHLPIYTSEDAYKQYVSWTATA